MRGDANQKLEMLSPVTPDTLVPGGHPIREIRSIVDTSQASCTGLRMSLFSTRVPSRIRSVTAATAASVGIGDQPSPTWSAANTMSKPSSSARTAVATGSPSIRDDS